MSSPADPTGGTAPQRICASLIVKNEEPVILRCLTSLKPLVDFIVVVDTGSTDRTKEIVRAFLAMHPGELHERPWRDFAHNRSEALTLARPYGDYTLVIDADDLLEFPADFQRPQLTADAYFVRIEDSATSYVRLQLVNNRLPWRYRGVLHEFLESGGDNSTAVLEGPRMRRNHDGARRKDPATYIKDAEILEKALETERDAFLRSRYRFYLAQSYRDCGKHAKALENYLARADLGFWDEEVFVSLLQAGRAMERLDKPVDDTLAVYERATAACPTRAEALHGAACLCRAKNMFAKGAEYARRGLKIAKPQHGLFQEDWIYKFGLLDEMGVNGYWAGLYAEALNACELILQGDKSPAPHRQRITDNANFCRQKIAEAEDKVRLKKPLKIAIYTIALDEAGHVERWSQSTADADYRIVADTGSTDETVFLLKKAGVDVHNITVKPWRFDDARNAVLALVPSDADICISLDMDEFMESGWRSAVEAAWTTQTTRLSYNYARGYNNDDTPAKVFRRSKVHSRYGYRWKRIVHEDIFRTDAAETYSDTPSLLMGERQDLSKNRGNYLPLLEIANQEDPSDSQICFWLARELMYHQKNAESAEKFLAYLALPTSNWADERSEAMRYLARVEAPKRSDWLRRAISEAPYRRELWHDLAELFHDLRDWPSLYWACSNGVEKCRLTGTYLDEPSSSGFRLYDLGALACSHIGLLEKAVSWGQQAFDLAPSDTRLKNNLIFYKDTLGKSRQASATGSVTVLHVIETEINLHNQAVRLQHHVKSRDITVCGVALPGYIHAAALAEISQIVVSALETLNYNVKFVSDPEYSNRCDILIGGHLLSKAQCAGVLAECCVYNSEHINSDFFEPSSKYYIRHYLDLLKRVHVWDFSADNSEAMNRAFGLKSSYVPLGYVSCLTRIAKQEEDIDVLFFGSPCSRREDIIDELTRRGLKVISVFGVYGTERDALIARSKVVLNIHKNMPGCFEIVRVAYLLANRKAVVSEINKGETVDPDLVGGFAAAPYETLVDEACLMVASIERRREFERRGFEKFASRSAGFIIAEALSRTRTG